VVVNIAVGKPVETIGCSADDRDALIARVRAEIEAQLRQLGAA